jgi:2-oxoisovalerate dehydrogenase E1 component
LTPLPYDSETGLLHEMLRIRAFEERAGELYRDGRVPGFVHLSLGQEAVAVGVCANLRKTDAIVSNHRGHGHCLAKGADMTAMFAELMGRDTGTCRGLGGSMHIADLDAGVYGANGIVGAGLPIAVGVAEAFRQMGTDDVVVAFFGDGAIGQGAFHEAMNLAGLWHLPVLFLCENNRYAEFSSFDKQHPVPVRSRGAAYGVESASVDGNDVMEVAKVSGEMVDQMRHGFGPFLLEAVTYRWRGHFEGDPQRYRDQDEVESWKERDPIVRIASRRTTQDVERLKALVAEEVDRAVESAAAGNSPVEQFLHEATYAQPRHDDGSSAELPVRVEDPYRVMDAIREALDREMSDRDDMWLAGIDVAEGGNVFALTRGLHARFPGRLRDTPISETAIMGLGVGGAMAGTHPVIEIMYLDFIGVCLDQLINQAAKVRFMSGGRAGTSLVVRTQYGIGRSSGSQHSQSLEALLTHIPGLKVVMPSTPADTYGLLRAAIADPAPVVFIENRELYGLKGPRAHPDHVVPIGKAAVRRSGHDATVVAWSRQANAAADVAGRLAAEGLADVEVIDLRTLVPLDTDTVFRSVTRTGRLLVVHDAVTRGGFGAEVAALVAKECFWDLDAPVLRLGGLNTPVPYAPSLEQHWMPSPERIRAAILSLVAT